MKKLLIFTGVAEATTGVALLVAPLLVGRLLLGTALEGVAIVVARVAGIALLALGVGCWPGTPLCGMLTYNALGTGYFTWLAINGQWAGPLLWPAAGLHAVLTILLGWAWFMEQKRAGGASPPAKRNRNSLDMKTTKQIILVGAMAGSIATTLFTGCTTATGADSSAATYKMTTSIAPGVAVPDKVETSIGTLHSSDGFPKPETIEKVYDNLDRARALQAYLLALPIVNQAAMRDTLRQHGPDNNTDVIWENLVDSKTVELTANDNTVYSFIWLDTHKGPLVVEVPPMVLGLIDDFWYKWVADIGITGEDRGKGGKYLILPPGYKDEVPAGYFVVRPSTYGSWMPFRSFLKDGSPKPGVESVKAHLKIYQLADTANPPAMKYVNLSGIPSNFCPPSDYTFWGLLDKVIQEEPSEGSDPTTLGLFAAIGIQKGKPFNPDARMKGILEDAAKIGSVTVRAIAYKIRDDDAFIYPKSTWRKPFFGGYKFEIAPGVANLDGAEFFYFLATGVTPAMAMKMVGEGSQYPWSCQDSDGNPFDGAKTYKLHLPPNIPVKTFWSVIVYDNQTRSMLQTDQQFPSVSSQDKGVKVNADGSVDVYFGPKAPAGEESNWIQTIPGKGWFMILRLYGPLEPWFDQTWRPDAIKLMK